MSFFLIKKYKRIQGYIYIYRVKEILPFKIFKRNSNKKKMSKPYNKYNMEKHTFSVFCFILYSSLNKNKNRKFYD
jgi:hypothetical protein